MKRYCNFRPLLQHYGLSMSHRSSMAVCALLFTTLVAGCGGEPAPEFSPVEGVVRINGKADRGLLVRFSPDPEKGNGLPAVASGTTDEQGKYTLKYEFRGEEGTGAPVGWHRVTVLDTKVGYTPQGQQPKPSAVPYQYGSVSATPLVVEVKAGDLQTIDLDVKK
jgi:hypothetical protein